MPLTRKSKRWKTQLIERKQVTTLCAILGFWSDPPPLCVPCSSFYSRNSTPGKFIMAPLVESITRSESDRRSAQMLYFAVLAETDGKKQDAICDKKQDPI